jgi:hypothetical protein
MLFHQYHYTQHDDTQHHGTQHNDTKNRCTQLKNTKCYTMYNIILGVADLRIAIEPAILSAGMLCAVMLSVGAPLQLRLWLRPGG